MATLYVTEYISMGQNSNSGPQAPQEPPVSQQVVAIAGISNASLPFNPKTRLIRVHTDTVCSIVFGVAPVATQTMARMAANQTEYHSVPEGGGFQVAAVINA